MITMAQTIETLTQLREAQALCEEMLPRAQAKNDPAAVELQDALARVKREAEAWQADLEARVANRQLIAECVSVISGRTRCTCGRTVTAHVIEDIEAVLVFATDLTERINDTGRLKALLAAIVMMCEHCLRAKREALEAIAAARASKPADRSSP